MEKTIINVPKGIRFLGEWQEFNLPEYPHILDKQITGCGFTEWAITCPMNVILVSPRLMLLENKEEQHQGQLYYAKNDLDLILDIDKDLSKEPKGTGILLSDGNESKEYVELMAKKVMAFKNQVQNYVRHCIFEEQIPCKLAVTYDSYRLIYDALMELGVFDCFYTIVDEFQSIFTDSRFKSSTEIEFVSYLQNVQKLCFVSATPMMEEYLDMLDEFKNLPMFVLDWGSLDPGRIIKPQLTIHPCQRITDTAVKIIQTYQEGNYERTIVRDEVTGQLKEIESRELVVYVNSVKNICDIIKKAGLTYDNTNVLCSRTPDNEKKIRKAFGLKKGDIGGIGKVPLRDDSRKMFTLCTRTVYLGSDFYSDNARSIILSDANIECLAVDITLDLPQILGRQRRLDNPWKNRAELYVKILSEKNRITPEKFVKYQTEKRKKTDNLLSAYQTSATSDVKHDLAETYQFVAKAKNYRDDYVAVNTHSGKDKIPVFNNLVMVSELRAFQIQQVDYADRFRVINQINQSGKYTIDPVIGEVDRFMVKFKSLSQFTDRMRLLCESSLTDKAKEIILSQIPIEYKTYLTTLSLEKLKACRYQKSYIDQECFCFLTKGGKDLKTILFSKFKVGERYSSLDIKNILSELYSIFGISSKAKATDLLNYFEVKDAKVNLVDETGKLIRVRGYELLKRKD